MTSWKTSLAGILTGLGMVLMQVNDPAWVHHLGVVLAAAGAAMLGTTARDNDKTSEDVGAGK